MKKLYQTMGKTPWKKCTVYLQLLHHFGEVFSNLLHVVAKKSKKRHRCFTFPDPWEPCQSGRRSHESSHAVSATPKDHQPPPPLHQRLATGPGATKIFGWILCPFPTSFPLRYTYIYIYKSKGISPKTFF